MNIIECNIPGLLIIEPNVWDDDRGFFLESWNADTFRAEGLDLNFVQDNHSRSKRGVLRGLHFQNPGAQGKLVRVVCGSVWDVVVDLRLSSLSFGMWFGVELSAANKRMLWVPEGFAHGFLTLADNTDFLYKCTSKFNAEHEHTLAWDDPLVGIDWPLLDVVPQISKKDQLGLTLNKVKTFA